MNVQIAEIQIFHLRQFLELQMQFLHVRNFNFRELPVQLFLHLFHLDIEMLHVLVQLIHRRFKFLYLMNSLPDHALDPASRLVAQLAFLAIEPEVIAEIAILTHPDHHPPLIVIILDNNAEITIVRDALDAILGQDHFAPDPDAIFHIIFRPVEIVFSIGLDHDFTVDPGCFDVAFAIIDGIRDFPSR